MAINSEIDNAPTHTTSIGQIGFYAVSVVFNLCLIAQLLTVGVAYFLNSACASSQGAPGSIDCILVSVVIKL